jgi:RHS repeat-associated protein
MSMLVSACNSLHRLTHWGGQAYSYDANGNLTNDGQRSYTWNARNELSSLSPVGASTVPPASFQYDPMGRRVGKSIGATPATTGYLYDGANFVQEMNEANNTQSGTDANQASLIANLLTAGIDSTLLRQRLTATGTTITASTPEHFLSDANNNTIAITNTATTPAITTRYDYSAYGESTTTTVSGTQSDNSQQYTGRENDSTGLMYYRARYYNPACARFISEDPIGWASGQTNNYAYVGGDPVSMTDPEGEFGVAGAVIGGGIDLAIQLAINGGNISCVNWGDVGMSMVIGALTGGLANGNFAWKAGSNTWGATRQWLGKHVWDLNKGQNVHHGIIPQGSWAGKNFPNIVNQPWNLTPMPSRAWHEALHKMDPISRTVLGAPGYAQGIGMGLGVAAGGGSGGGCN